MRVQLLSYTPQPEQVVAAAARLCYSDSTIDHLLGQAEEQIAKLLAKILELGHYSVLEHASFTFGIEGISRACSHQLVRHRIASFSQQSQRYVSHETQFHAVTPPSIAADPVLKAKFEGFLTETHRVYSELLAAGIPAEDARFVLPNAAATKLVMTMNARELHHFFALRCCRRAQWEIRLMAKEMLLLARKSAPLLFKDAGPGCLRGACPEGSMTCGKAVEVRNEYQHINISLQNQDERSDS
ncbi:MAG: FAD-dependent thymidylate synthase [Deltaproteobacteria bacterium]|jgi:thymidylate synthase (FAD)|nr:FAD-dependent thymidylate synthase [Deltaproteobacteria bacterium]MBW2505143.1 FAD-dependent thymidylate synthase [Deltaproteobacteria bacterium]MBW2520055.1 FAD-dependent thymidylate synthase [Deltaproteobacteria bacterium]